MSRLSDVHRLAQPVAGWLRPLEGEFLYNAAKKCPKDSVIVEIGSWKGKSTVYLASGSKDGNKNTVYAIDPHTGSSEHKKKFGKVWTFEEFKKNINKAGVDDVVVPLVKTSEAAAKNWNKKIGLLWIDGAHEYEMVLLDYQLWSPHLVKGGVIAFHDSQDKGPKKVVNKHLYSGNRFKNVGFIDGITYATLVDNISITDRLTKLYVLFLTTIYSFAGKLPLPKIVKVLGNKLARMLQ